MCMDRVYRISRAASNRVYRGSFQSAKIVRLVDINTVLIVRVDIYVYYIIRFTKIFCGLPISITAIGKHAAAEA